MLKNSPEHFNNLEIINDKIIIESLQLQLQKMLERAKYDRGDTKFKVLQAFVQALEVKFFQRSICRT